MALQFQTLVVSKYAPIQGAFQEYCCQHRPGRALDGFKSCRQLAMVPLPTHVGRMFHVVYNTGAYVQFPSLFAVRVYALLFMLGKLPGPEFVQ